MIPCSLVEVYWHIGGTHFLHPQGQRVSQACNQKKNRFCIPLQWIFSVGSNFLNLLNRHNVLQQGKGKMRTRFKESHKEAYFRIYMCVTLLHMEFSGYVYMAFQLNTIKVKIFIQISVGKCDSFPISQINLFVLSIYAFCIELLREYLTPLVRSPTVCSRKPLVWQFWFQLLHWK